MAQRKLWSKQFLWLKRRRSQDARPGLPAAGARACVSSEGVRPGYSLRLASNQFPLLSTWRLLSVSSGFTLDEIFGCTRSLNIIFVAAAFMGTCIYQSERSVFSGILLGLCMFRF